MIASEETLFRTIYSPHCSPLPPFGRFLSQGVAAGAIIYFLVELFILLQAPHWKSFFVFLLPLFLVWGMLVGLCVGLVIWASTRLAGQGLNVVVRSALGIVAVAIFAAGFYSLLTALGVNWDWSDSSTNGVYLGVGVAYGLVTGSRLQPWREFVRGSEEAKSRVLTGITGLVLRVLIVWGLLESILSVCALLQDSEERYPAVIALCYFAAASMIVFARMKFWLLLPLALLVNLPVAWLIEVMLKNELPVYRYLTFSYLGIWAAFLLARCSLTYSMLRSLKEELRYYLID
jgi:hypothetical protein